MGKYGFSDEMIGSWRDESIILSGDGDTAVVLVHGWSAFPRQVLDLGRLLNKKGYWIYAPRLTGHGRVPEQLAGVGTKDWLKDTNEAIIKARSNSRIKNIIVGGISMGGSLAVLGSVKEKVEGVVLLGTPIHIRHHFIIWISAKIFSLFNLYFNKRYPKTISKENPAATSYQYFPARSVLECLATIRTAAFSLNKVTAPTLILQTSADYMVTKYSPWVIYHRIKSKVKKLQWVQSKYENHTITDDEVDDTAEMIGSFISDILNKNKKI